MVVQELKGSEPNWDGLGMHEFTIVPRVADYLDLDGHFYEVVAVTLADRDDQEGAGDVIVRKLGDFQAYIHAIAKRYRTSIS